MLLKCFSVLLEIPEVLKQKRPAATTESLQHMVACITYYLAKVVITYYKLRKKFSSVFKIVRNKFICV